MFKFYTVYSKCTFGIHPSRIDQCYGCRVTDQEIPENQDCKISGQHESGMSNNDVISVHFENCTITKVPQGLIKIFPNLRILDIWNSKLSKICKNDLIDYVNLKKLRCEFNNLEFLTGDLFEGFERLEFISFNNNKLSIIEPCILDGLKNLKYVDFRDNPNYSQFYSIYPENHPNSTLDGVKIEIAEKFFKKFKFFQDLKTSEDNLKKENQELKDSKLKLEAELEQEKFKNFKLVSRFETGIIDDVKAFIEDETTKDFQITIDSHEFPVHKFLIAARSPTLAEILKNNPEVENLNLVDISVETFEIIHNFLYTDELPGDDGTNYLHLFAAAGKLKIE
ncbi:unnamed protein product [Chironomus riparius]|uniref:BTB domain-containing protein n=1 Tax=Chironomus riparius TaxID=315576 RepID=A0A9N9S878_9DIPT|nr:unnamed protein product [Chironomus riparius]